MSSTLSGAVEPGATPHETYVEKLHDHARIAPGDIAVGVILGRTSEYFDFFVFGIACVLVFPQVFFPTHDPLHGMLLAFVLFALAFVVRPFGTALFMAVQRRWGRGVKLSAALVLLGTATVFIGFLPGYASIGGWAIAMLAFFRFCQGMAFGGSWDGLPSLLAMNTPPDRRGWYAMLGQVSAPMGFLLASGLFLYLYSHLSTEDFLGWGWRYPFFVAFSINVVALFARLRLVLTEEYTAALEERELEPVRVRTLMHEQGHNVFLGAFAALASYALFHLVTIFPLSWVALGHAQTISQVLSIQVIGAMVGIVFTILSGVLADRIGRRTTLGSLAALIGVFSLSAPWLLDGGRTGQDVFILVGFALLGLSYGQSAGSVTSNFETRLRYTGAAITSDLAWLIGAAFAPLVALGLSERFGLAAVSVYLLSGVACTLVALGVNKSLAERDM